MTASQRINRDGRVFGENGEPDYFIPGHFAIKLLFFLASILVFLVGAWELWGPASRCVFGETAAGRIVYLVRESPGEPEETIRVRREIKEGDYPYDTIFRHFVSVPRAEGGSRVMQLAVASRQTPYALVNDRVRVAFFPGDSHAYGIRQHRTWAFGAGFLLVGTTFLCISGFLLSMVGKKVYIDPEDPAHLELERELEALDDALHNEKGVAPQDMEPQPPPFEE